MSSAARRAAAPVAAADDGGHGRHEPTLRRLSDRQADTVDRLVDATVTELRRDGFAGLTVRNVARSAGVAPATAYTYFRSREHLVTEVFWRRLAALPERRPDRRRSAAGRVADAFGDLSLLVADEPELASACTAALLADDPDVALLRDRIGRRMRRHLQHALGEDEDPDVLAALELALSGALVHAGVGNCTYDELPVRLARVAELVVPPRRRPATTRRPST